MTTKTNLSGGQWTLIASAPTRVLLQVRGGDVELHLGSNPDSTQSGFLIKSNDFADFIKLDDFGVSVYARPTGQTAEVYHVEA